MLQTRARTVDEPTTKGFFKTRKMARNEMEELKMEDVEVKQDLAEDGGAEGRGGEAARHARGRGAVQLKALKQLSMRP